MTTTPRGRAADDEVETEHDGARDHKRERGMNHTTAEHEGGPRDDEGGPRMTRGRNERGDVRGAVEGANVGGTGKVRESGDAVRAGGGRGGGGFCEFDPERSGGGEPGDGVVEFGGVRGAGFESAEVPGFGGREVVDGGDVAAVRCAIEGGGCGEGFLKTTEDGTRGNGHGADGTR